MDGLDAVFSHSALESVQVVMEANIYLGSWIVTQAGAGTHMYTWT